jgi:hypothetical protein
VIIRNGDEELDSKKLSDRVVVEKLIEMIRIFDPCSAYFVLVLKDKLHRKLDHAIVTI